MERETVVIAGGLPAGQVSLEKVAARFGWSLRYVSDLDELGVLSRDQRVAAVLFSPVNLALPWHRALQKVLDLAPGALPILCHRFGDSVDWPQAAKAGAFHSLLMPFSEGEVRQSLGFVWSARSRNRIQTVVAPSASGQPVSSGVVVWPEQAA